MKIENNSFSRMQKMGTNKNCYHLSLSGEVVHGGRQLAQSAARVLLKAVCLLQFWSERAGQRRRLAALDGRMLKDIGISSTDAARESAKWFWQD
jgi:uncharacterized protein YjiS (DUF1127 family)